MSCLRGSATAFGGPRRYARPSGRAASQHHHQRRLRRWYRPPPETALWTNSLQLPDPVPGRTAHRASPQLQLPCLHSQYPERLASPALVTCLSAATAGPCRVARPHHCTCMRRRRPPTVWSTRWRRQGRAARRGSGLDAGYSCTLGKAPRGKGRTGRRALAASEIVQDSHMGQVGEFESLPRCWKRWVLRSTVLLLDSQRNHYDVEIAVDFLPAC